MAAAAQRINNLQSLFTDYNELGLDNALHQSQGAQPCSNLRRWTILPVIHAISEQQRNGRLKYPADNLPAGRPVGDFDVWVEAKGLKMPECLPRA